MMVAFGVEEGVGWGDLRANHSQSVCEICGGPEHTQIIVEHVNVLGPFTHVQLPRSYCNCEKPNYTLIHENEQGDVIAEVGTFPLLDSGIVKESITSDLKENQNYSLRLQVDAQSQTASSQRYFFSKK